MRQIGNKRIQNMPVSIFSTMSMLAHEHKAVNLGQGFPDFDGPKWIMEEAYKAMQEGKNQYAPMQGIHSIRKTLQSIYKDTYSLDIDIDDITITAGATEALFSTINALIDEGDEVVMFEPFYDSYQANVILAGGIGKYVTLHKPDFSFTEEELRNAISDKTRLIIINNPHNPSGKVFTKQELEIIAKLAIEKDLLVLSDEVYEYLTFDDAMHIPIATIEGMKERTVTISSTGKTFGLTGWKIGYTIASPAITKAIRSVHQWATFAVNTPGQHAMAYAFQNIKEYLPEFRSLYLRKRDIMLEELAKTKFKALVPKGTYFMFAEIPGTANDIDAAMDLVKRCKVATIPPSVFYQSSDEGKTMLRLCFAKQDETIIDGIRKMAEY